MFPHTITVYRHEVEQNRDVYRSQVISGFYWYGSKAVSLSGHGFSGSCPVTVVSSPKMAAEFGVSWDVRPKDRIVKGEGGIITSWKDLQEAVTVLRVSDNRCGGSVDNITIEGE